MYTWIILIIADRRAGQSNISVSSDSRSTSTTISTSAIQEIVDRLKLARHQASTKKMYYSVWKSFNQFFVKLDRKPSAWKDRIVLYIGYLIDNHRQSATIKSYISAIKAVLQDNGIALDQDQALLTSLTRACRLQNDRVRMRLPIRQGMLQILVKNMPRLYKTPQPYLEALYIAMLCTAYFRLFRIGEITASEHVLKMNNVQIGENKDKLKFVLETSKTHGKDSMPQIVKKIATSNASQPHLLFLFNTIQNYLNLRKQKKLGSEPFFVFTDRSPVTAYPYRRMLKKLLKLSGFNEKFYDTHSTRAGRAIDLYHISKLSLETIRKCGHWKLLSIYAYLQTTF